MDLRPRHTLRKRRFMEKLCVKLLWCSVAHWHRPFNKKAKHLVREKTFASISTQCFIQSDHGRDSIFLRTDETSPVRALMEDTSWKDNANSSCVKRDKQTFSLWGDYSMHSIREHCCDRWRTTLMREIINERGYRQAPLLSREGKSTALGIVNCYPTFSKMGKSIFYSLSFYSTLFLCLIFHLFVSSWLPCPLVSVTLSLTWPSCPLKMISFWFDFFCWSVVVSLPKAVHKSIWISYSTYHFLK